MWQRMGKIKWFLTGLTIALFTALSLLAAGWAPAQADDGEWIGLVEAMPADGLIGDWLVGGRAFATDANTEFRTEKGALALGACVEVEFDSASPERADKIATKSSDDCQETPTPSETATPDETTTPSPTASVTPSATPTDDGDDDGDDDDGDETKGRVDQMPARGLVGDWTINGVAYAATASTRFRQSDGPLVVGACVEVKFSGAAAPFVLREIETEDDDDCHPEPTATPSPTGAPDGVERYGRLDSFPAGLVGDWEIDGVAYVANANTEFKTRHGPFAVGACIKVHTTTVAPPFVAREIETEQQYRCGGDDDGGANAEGELYGVLQSFPDGLVGEWNIGGMSFIADATTEFKQERGQFAVGVTVKAHFVVGDDGLNHAREIETKFANDDDGVDDDGNGSFEGAEGQAYGLIEQFPASLVGDWTISGVDYRATEQTRFEERDGAFAVGVRVKVEYFVDATGQRVAQKIEVTDDEGGAGAENRFTLFGFVRAMPARGFSGEWVVDNVRFSADTLAQFKEDHGVLGLGAYVKVEYAVVDGQNLIHEVETHVPPGAGPTTTLGRLDDRGSGAQTASMRTGVWVVGGIPYVVTPATKLNDAQGGLAVGSTVMVNSYLATDGSQVATLVRGVTLSETLHLPVVTR